MEISFAMQSLLLFVTQHFGPLQLVRLLKVYAQAPCNGN